MNLQPILEGELVRMRPMRADDFDALYAVASDPLLWEQHPLSDRYRRPVFEKLFADGLASEGALVAEVRGSGKVIGSSRFYWEKGELVIGYTYLARAFWGQGHNRDMKSTMLAHAFASGVSGVLFHVGDQNLRSRRAMEKLGALLLPQVQSKQHGNLSITHVIYKIDREIFAKNFG